MSFQIRPLSAEHAAQVDTLLTQCFPVLPNSSYFADFPGWRIDSFKKPVWLGGWYGDELVATAFFCLNTLKTPTKEPVTVASIGGVATLSEFRGKGFATRLIDTLIKEIQKTPADLAVLFSDSNSFYKKWDFQLLGREVRILLADLVRGIQPLEVVEEGFRPHIFSMLQSRPMGFVLRPEDEKWIRAHEHILWFSTPDAYCALGKGMDLQGMVHEWGGNPESLKSLLAYVSKHHPEAQIMTSPYLAAFSEQHEKHSENPMGLFKVIHAENIFRAFRRQSLPETWKTQTSNEIAQRLFKSAEIWLWGLDAF